MNIDIILIFSLITILSISLFIVTFLSYYKHKKTKLLMISFVFLFLFVRGLLLSLSIFYEQIDALISSNYIWIFDLIILILLYGAYSYKR